MGLRDIGATLPPGFRFYPSDEELVCHYLYKKIANEDVLKGTLVDIDLHTCEPWQLPELAKLNASEWYFFSFRDRKYATGFRTNRATTAGYWKATGKDRTVLDPLTREVVGMRKTLVFYRNRAPNGIKTGWIMHEFRLETPHMPPKEDWVLCRVFHKGKETDQNSTNRLPEMVFEATAVSTISPNIGPHNHTMPFGCQNITSNHHQQQHHQNLVNQNSLLNLQFSLDRNISSTNSVANVGSKGDDDYGFFWDMNLEENSLVSSSLEDMRFEIDNSMVFI
ncbi:NAC domain protein [Tripterygium wilfordii]|uniref:NAC domain protein n=1 Tax=Tripterygium wilfordii TaxID=458696 RepID=A0A7J7CXZ8_TRIWF|nr:NAC domain-containing protein 21/22-like [Tripterygium wilfordii]KAF5738953.1 NAC domain protein [Tripterygium wilfordii]